MKRDDVHVNDLEKAGNGLKMLSDSLAAYNQIASHSALGMKIQVEYRLFINYAYPYLGSQAN